MNLGERRSVSVALRYENISLDGNPEGERGTGCAATVTEKIYMGGMFRFETRTEQGASLTADVSNTGAARLVAEGDEVHLVWRPGEVSVLLELGARQMKGK